MWQNNLNDESRTRRVLYRLSSHIGIATCFLYCTIYLACMIDSYGFNPGGGVLLYADRRDERPIWVGQLRKIPLKVGSFSNKAL